MSDHRPFGTGRTLGEIRDDPDGPTDGERAQLESIRCTLTRALAAIRHDHADIYEDLKDE